jgi:Neurotransmitter-gated ion-channel ligand binding domain
MRSAELLTPDFSGMRVLIRHDGRVHWEPGGVFTTTCDIDVRFFPFDDQLCSIQFGAWAYYSARMNITNVSPNISVRL